MKKLIFPVLILTAVSFTSPKYYTGASTAEVNQEQGIYIFTDSKPVQQYEYLGTLTAKGAAIASDGLGKPVYTAFCNLSYSQMKASIINQAKKKYKDFTAIIIDPQTGVADIVKF